MILFSGLLAAAVLGVIGALHVYWAAGGKTSGVAIPERNGALPPWMFRVGVWGVLVVFVARAVGDFRLVGLFKRVRDSRFAHWDTMLFTPLCLVIALLLLVVARS